MANALCRDIEKGELVVLHRGLFRQESQGIENRVFACESGFGMQSATAGTTIFGYWLDGSGRDKTFGYAIDEDETLAYQAANGRFFRIPQAAVVENRAEAVHA